MLRYSALGLGVFYGFYHQRTIYSSDKAAAAKREYEHKQSLINQAKAEYSKLHAPAPSATSASSGRKLKFFDRMAVTNEGKLNALSLT